MDVATRTGRLIQALIIACSLLGAALLVEIHMLVPTFVFDFISAGWVCFVLDSILTFVRPRASYYFGLLLSGLGLAASLPQGTHWSFIEDGMVVPSAIFISGSLMQGAIIVLVVYYHLVRQRSTTNSALEAAGGAHTPASHRWLELRL